MYTIRNSKLKTQNSKQFLGQTVLEVIVGLTLIILFLSGVVVLELLAIKNVEFAKNKSIAASLARQQLERARVVRDSAGTSALSVCQATTCHINSYLTPEPVIPTGRYVQTLRLETATAADCVPDVTITPAPVVYKTTAIVSWAQGTAITPAPEVSLSSCITDWR